MYFNKKTILFVFIAFVAISESAVKRKCVKTKKIRKCNYANVAPPPCICQNPILEFVNCGCRGPMLEQSLGALAPFEIALPGCQNPIIDIPKYRPAETIELNPLGCLFPSIEIPNYGLLTAPMSPPTVEYYAAVDLPCGCPGPKCGCPPMKLPTYEEYITTIEVPSCGCQISGIPAYSYGTSVIEIPSYAPAPIMQIPCGCRKPPACGCQGPCSCSGYPVSSCGCQEPCSCPTEFQIVSCGCQGCSSSGIPISSCGCQGPCGCTGVPKPCGCQGSCGCSGIQATVGLLPTIEYAPCGCPGPCACPAGQMSTGLLPAIELPSCGCGCNIPGCNCQQYARQLTLQPPFM